jgi:hypothetical protein
VRGGVEVDVCGAAEGNAHGDAAMAVAVAVSAGMRGAVADCGFVAAGPGLLLSLSHCWCATLMPCRARQRV